MTFRNRRARLAVATTVVLGAVSTLLLTGVAQAGPSPLGSPLTNVPTANTKAPGVTSPSVLSPELSQIVLAQGSTKLENGTAAVPYYGYEGNGTLLPIPGATTQPVEATKTEPDKNTYLRLKGQRGADPNYDYGTRFLFQGHEGGSPGYLTRINLDADGAHRVTLLATTETGGKPLPDFDGSTWDPWVQRLLFTAERGNQGGVWQATPDVNSQVQDISAALGRGGYEGIQNDSAGNLWVVEDVGGATVPGTNAKLPNSFVYRFVPTNPRDLTSGTLQALQVSSNTTGQPITFQAIDGTHPQGNAFSADQKALHTFGNSFTTRWVTIHDTATATDPSGFDANAAAKTAGATPFKRPENGQFRPGSNFREFFFDETGDTNLTSTANADFGGFGSVLKLTQSSPTADTGRLELVYKGDKEHTGFDNVAFVDANRVAFVEDAGDTLHTQRNALDSGYLFDVTRSYANGQQPLRFLAEGRDPSATIDSGFLGMPGFQNDGDNEITGLHVSDGDPGIGGILGAKRPNPFPFLDDLRLPFLSLADNEWRAFYTQQHGDNPTYEIVRARR